MEEKHKDLSMKVQNRCLKVRFPKLTKMRDESKAAATETEKIILEWEERKR